MTDSGETAPGRRRRVWTWRLVRTAVNLLALGGMAWFLGAHAAELRALRPAPVPLLVAAACVLLLQVFRARVLQVLVRENGRALGFGDALDFVSFGTICNLLLPSQMGSVYLAAQIRRRLGSGFLVAGALQAASLVVRILVDSVLVLVGYVWAGVDAPLVAGVYLAWIGAILACCAVLARVHGRIGWSHPLLQSLRGAIQCLVVPRIASTLAFYSALESACLAAIVMGVLRALGVDASIAAAVFFTGVRNTSIALALTPGALGISELVVAWAGDGMGLAPATSVSVALAVRVLVVLGCGLVVAGALARGSGRSSARSP